MEAPNAVGAVSPVPLVTDRTSWLPASFSYRGIEYQLPDLARHCMGKKLLYLYSGLLRPGSIDECCAELKLVAINVDGELGLEFDMLDQARWEALEVRTVAGEFLGLLISPPCSTFSDARGADGNVAGRPQVLRGSSPSDIHGYPAARADPLTAT